MCGICGVVLPADSDREITERQIVRMRDLLRHRGPDDEGLFLEEGVGLGHRRLSIVDVAAGHQPMASDDGDLRIVYNGEVYNHADLRARLEARGHRYRTRCDTETVLRLCEEEGPDALVRLRGMFAFGLWSRKRRELLLARDRLGIKPLYYAHLEDGALVFGSEIKAILASGFVRARLNHDTLPDYLANHAPSGDKTLFRGIRRVPPGHTLAWRDGRVDLRPYWSPRLSPGFDRRPERELVDTFRDLFDTSVRMRLMADVPLGVFLSGGLDSAAIAATMTHHVDEPIKTFSVAFAERQANELGYARTVAESFGTDHHEVVVSPEEFFSALPDLIWHEDEPLAHPSSVPLHFVSRLAAEHVKVVLTGEGSDELLAGYLRYPKTLVNVRGAKAWQRWAPAAARRLVRRGLAGLPASWRSGQLGRRSFLYLDAGLESLYLDNFAVFSRDRIGRLLAQGAKERIGPPDPYRAQRELLARSDAATPLARLLHLDLETYLAELLMKQDQMSMSASVESRVPFLDQELVEFATRLPDRFKLRGRTTKWILRESMKDVLPASILERPKMGFPVPFGAWVRGPWQEVVTETIAGERALARQLFEPQVVCRLLAEHVDGRVDHSERLWSLLNIELWQRQFLDGDQSNAWQAGGRGGTASLSRRVAR